MPVYNMEKFIESALLSILKQSFQNFEIILVNDNSVDKTLEIISKYQINDDRIKIINHPKNLGVYCSRKDAIFNSKGEYIMLMDPDDMLLNQDLFKELYNYNLKYNVDVIEFLVYYQDENKPNIYMRSQHIFNHWHNFGKTIIYQPELSNIFFLIPKSYNITSTICRIVWNKIIRKEVLVKSVNYVEKIFKSRYMITADDTPINIMALQFAKNYSNAKIPGYLYTKRIISMSRGQNKELNQIRGYNFLLYYQFLFSYVKEYEKNINFFFKDFDDFHHNLYMIKNLNITSYIPKTIKFLNILIKIEDIPNKSKLLIQKLLIYFQNNTL